jgi:hypothetical protein
LNAGSGAHYAAWVYPENSIGGSKLIKLIRFSDWTTFTVLQTASLPSVGTNWHTVRLACQGNQIAIWYDNVQVITTTDPAPFLNGGVSLDMWTDATPYIMSADDVLVTPLAAPDSYALDENTLLNVSPPGVLGNDSNPSGQIASAQLISNPSHGSVTLNTNGSFNYTPTANYVGTDAFIYQANDGAASLGTAWVYLTVNANASNVVTVIQSMSVTNRIARIVWSSIAGRTYRPQFRNLLSVPTWSNLPPDILATGPTASTTDALNTRTQRFYRIMLLP